MNQMEMFPVEPPSPHEAWDNESAKRALDDLFKATLAHRQSGGCLILGPKIVVPVSRCEKRRVVKAVGQKKPIY